MGSEMKGCRTAILWGAAACFWSMPALAQTVPDAGGLQRQLRQGAPEMVQPAVPAATSAPAPGPDTGPRLAVRGFVIDGATLIPAAQLEALLQDRVGTQQSLRDLQTAAQIIADAYRAHRYFARAILPAQEADNGVVHIQVIEGRFGRLETAPGQASGLRVNQGFAQAVVGARLVPGQPYSMDDLERGLLLANDLPGVAADGTLKAGTAFGTSDLAVTVHDTPFITGSAGIDNAGTKSTGLYRANAGLAFNNWTGFGDQLTVQAVGSERLGYGSAGWSVPVGPDGWRAGVSFSRLDYWLGDTFKALDAHGTATTLGADLSYPLVRHATENLRADVAYEYGRYDDDALHSALHRKQIHRGRVTVNGDETDSLGGGGQTAWRTGFTIGHLDLSDLAADAAQDRATAGAAGTFAKLTFDARRDQAVGAGLVLRGRAAGQWASGNLDSSEQFSLGGPGGVRAYPVNEGSGDHGVLANLELHRPFSSGPVAGLDLYGFLDGGVVSQHAQTWAGWNAGGKIPNSYPLFGAGIGASYALSGLFTVDVTVAAPIGANVGSARAGHNQDGSPTDPRAWFTLTALF